MFAARIPRKSVLQFGQFREYLRYFSSREEAVISTTSPNPKKIDSDMVGPVDPMSNLRRIVLRHRTNETPLEIQLRQKRMEVHDWNQQFWSRHNTNFYEGKKEYMKKNTNADQQTLTADEMSVFYKEFLDKNWHLHIQYNKEWYMKNIQLLLLSLLVRIQRFKQRRM